MNETQKINDALVKLGLTPQQINPLVTGAFPEPEGGTESEEDLVYNLRIPQWIFNENEGNIRESTRLDPLFKEEKDKLEDWLKENPGKSAKDFFTSRWNVIKDLEESEEDKQQRKQAFLKLLLHYQQLSQLYYLKKKDPTYLNLRFGGTLKVPLDSSPKGITYSVEAAPVLNNAKLNQAIADLRTDGIEQYQPNGEVDLEAISSVLENSKSQVTTDLLQATGENGEKWANPVEEKIQKLEDNIITYAAKIEFFRANIAGFPMNADHKKHLEALDNSLDTLANLKVIKSIRKAAQDIYEKERNRFPGIIRGLDGAAKETEIRKLMRLVQEDSLDAAKLKLQKLQKLQQNPESILLKKFIAQQKGIENIIQKISGNSLETRVECSHQPIASRRRSSRNCSHSSRH